jgi:ComF family protein
MFDSGKVCIECKAATRLFKKAVAPFNFCDSIVSLVYRLKYGAETYLSKYMAYFMTQEIVKNKITFDTIIPVPLSDKRLKLRGFNQAELLAKDIANNLNVICDSDSLIRTRDTLTQTHLSKLERKDNLKQAFKVADKNKIKGKKILLVDDIFTTGATSDEISKVLLDNGCKQVVVITFAHAINKKEQSKTKNISKKD